MGGGKPLRGLNSARTVLTGAWLISRTAILTVKSDLGLYIPVVVFH